MKIQCSKYSNLDDKVISKATSLGLPLIGGTALEIWASHYNHPGVRKRSDNDLDFIAVPGDHSSEFRIWVQQNIPSDKVEVDLMYIRSHDISEYKVFVDGVLTMTLGYLLWSKLTRRTEKDIQDIKWIMSISQLSDEEIVNTFEDLGVTEEEIDFITNL